MANRILVINPGSTSTKIALFVDEQKLAFENIRHSAEDLASFKKISDQYSMREIAILDFLKRQGHTPSQLSCVVGRGGLLRPIEGGTYRVNEKMLVDLKEAQRGEHASNLGALIAHSIASSAHKEAYIVDPVVVDEMMDEARFSGLKELDRISIFHALNHKSVARKAAEALNKDYQDCNFVVAHLGGGISIGAHKKGRVVDVNQALNGEGCFTPERSGTLPAWATAELAFKYVDTPSQLKKMITGQGGLVSYLGTNDLREVEKRIQSGDEYARSVRNAMICQIAKDIGAMTTVLAKKPDAIILTGGAAHDEAIIKGVKERVKWIAPVMVYPGEAEMEALCEGALRVLRNEEKAKEY